MDGSAPQNEESKQDVKIAFHAPLLSSAYGAFGQVDSSTFEDKESEIPNSRSSLDRKQFLTLPTVILGHTASFLSPSDQSNLATGNHSLRTLINQRDPRLRQIVFARDRGAKQNQRNRMHNLLFLLNARLFPVIFFGSILVNGILFYFMAEDFITEVYTPYLSLAIMICYLLFCVFLSLKVLSYRGEYIVDEQNSLPYPMRSVWGTQWERLKGAPPRAAFAFINLHVTYLNRLKSIWNQTPKPLSAYLTFCLFCVLFIAHWCIPLTLLTFSLSVFTHIIENKLVQNIIAVFLVTTIPLSILVDLCLHNSQEAFAGCLTRVYVSLLYTSFFTALSVLDGFAYKPNTWFYGDKDVETPGAAMGKTYAVTTLSLLMAGIAISICIHCLYFAMDFDPQDSPIVSAKTRAYLVWTIAILMWLFQVLSPFPFGIASCAAEKGIYFHPFGTVDVTWTSDSNSFPVLPLATFLPNVPHPNASTFNLSLISATVFLNENRQSYELAHNRKRLPHREQPAILEPRHPLQAEILLASTSVKIDHEKTFTPWGTSLPSKPVKGELQIMGSIPIVIKNQTTFPFNHSCSLLSSDWGWANRTFVYRHPSACPSLPIVTIADLLQQGGALGMLYNVSENVYDLNVYGPPPVIPNSTVNNSYNFDYNISIPIVLLDPEKAQLLVTMATSLYIDANEKNTTTELNATLSDQIPHLAPVWRSNGYSMVPYYAAFVPFLLSLAIMFILSILHCLRLPDVPAPIYVPPPPPIKHPPPPYPPPGYPPPGGGGGGDGGGGGGDGDGEDGNAADNGEKDSHATNTQDREGDGAVKTKYD